MERQALLEQKRQRLLELRQRRSEIHSADLKDAASSPEPQVRKKVDFSVQVDLISESHTHASIDSAPEPNSARNILKFDKSIQTDDLSLLASDVKSSTEEQSALITSPPEVTDLKQADVSKDSPIQDPRSIVRDNLCDQLNAWNIEFFFSDLRLGLQQTKEHDPTTEPFQIMSQLHNFLSRPIVQVVPNLHFLELILVVYGKMASPLRYSDVKGTSSAGLAVIFNTKSSKLVPEFFLQCTSTITSSTFDKSNPTKVFAGLENGQVVMWDLSKVLPTKIALLPALQTSLIVSKENFSKKGDFIPHTSPILYIGQPSWVASQDSTFVSLCSGGVVNMWSPNMLAIPKVSSIKVGVSLPRVHEQLFISTCTAANSVLKQAQRESNLDSPELGFLERFLIGTKTGLIQTLANNKESFYLGHKVCIPIKRDSPYDCGIKSIVEITFQKVQFLLCVHADWHLSLWDLQSGKLLCDIPTAAAITGVAPRPHKNHQFVAYGDVKPPQMCFTVEFWDLLVQITSPLFEIPVKESQSGTVSFSDNGSLLYVAYSNGDIDVYAIDEEILNKRVETSAKSTYDKGLVSIQRSIEI